MTSSAAPCLSRREANRQTRRDAILDVAAGSFLERGYAGTTMSAIAAQLGGSKGTLWSYFPAKDVLYAAVIDRVTDAFRAKLSLILRPDDGLETALRRFCTEFLRRITSPEAIALYRLVIGEAKRFPEVGRIFFDRAPRPTQALLAEFLQGAMGRGELRAADPKIAARQLTSFCMYGCHQQMLMGLTERVSTEALEADVEAAMKMFLAMYGPLSPAGRTAAA